MTLFRLNEVLERYNEEINGIVTLLLCLTYSLNFIDTVSFKLTFLIQFSLVFFLLRNCFRINKVFIGYSIIVISYLYFDQDVKYFSYLLVFTLINAFFDIRKYQAPIFRYPTLVYIFLIFIMYAVSRKVGVHSNVDIALLSNIESFFFRYRHTLFNYDSNYASILVMIIYNLLFHGRQKFFLLMFSIFSFIVISLTLSKSGVIFYLSTIFFYLIKMNLNKKLFIIIMFNTVLFLIGDFYVKKFENPYKYSGSRSLLLLAKELPAQIYYKSFCTHEKIKYVWYLTDCQKGNEEWRFRDTIIIRVLGVSTYLKFYSIGFVANDIIKNYQNYLLPNGNIKSSKRFKNKEHALGNYFAAHNFILAGIKKIGFIYFFILLINLYYLIKAKENFNMIQILVATSLIGVDIMLFSPIIILSVSRSKNT